MEGRQPRGQPEICAVVQAGAQGGGMTDFLPAAEPQNVEAEQALLGSILIAPELFREANACLANSSDFYVHANGHIWSAFQSLDKQEKPINSLTVMDELDKSGSNGDIKGSELAALMCNIPTPQHAVAYATMVAEQATRRRLLAYCSDVARMANDERLGLLDALSKAQKSLNEIPVRHSGTTTLTDQLSALYDQVEERRKNPKEIWGIPIGIPKIDRETGGQQRGELTILAGQPKIGKSMFAGQIAYYGAHQGFNCGIYSLEMRNEQILRRQIATLSGLSTQNMRSGFISDGDWAAFVRHSSELSKLPLFICDDSSLTLEQIRADIYRRSKERRVDLVVVDYIGLINDPEKDDNVRENNLTKGLKRIAMQEDVSILAIHSMNKEGLDKIVPKLSSVSGPVKNVYNADNIVFFLNHFPAKGAEPNPNMRTLFFAAMRDAPGLSYVNLNRILGRPGFEPEPDFPIPDNEPPNWSDT
jgi:replicative DNA helicase